MLAYPDEGVWVYVVNVGTGADQRRDRCPHLSSRAKLGFRCPERNLRSFAPPHRRGRPCLRVLRHLAHCFRYNTCMSDVKTVRLTETVKAAG